VFRMIDLSVNRVNQKPGRMKAQGRAAPLFFLFFVSGSDMNQGKDRAWRKDEPGQAWQLRNKVDKDVSRRTAAIRDCIAFNTYLEDGTVVIQPS
jgi:hypothetical protein